MRVCLFRKSLLHHHAGDVAQGVVHGRGQRHAAQEYLAGALANDGGDEIELRLVEQIYHLDGTTDGEIEKGIVGESDAVFRAVGARDEGGYVIDVSASAGRDETGGEGGELFPIFGERTEPEMHESVHCVVARFGEDAGHDALLVFGVKMHK